MATIPTNVMLWLTLLITAIVTTLIVWGRSWIVKNREKRPEIYGHRRAIDGVIYVVLNLGDLLK